MSYTPIDFIVKSIMIGDQNVGKTTLSRKVADNYTSYDNNTMPTVGVDFFTLNTNVNDASIRLYIWDTAGNERFQNLIKLYFKNNAICYVVYDVCNELSFKNIPIWIDTFKNNTSNHNAILVIVGNKIDHKNTRVITYEQGKTLADNYNALYIEVSSRAEIGLKRLIEEPLERLFELYDGNKIIASDANGLTNIADDNEKFLKKRKGCCIVQ